MPDCSVNPFEATRASAKELDVLRLVLYYDIFRHPLRSGEAERLLGGAIGGATERLVERGLLEQQGPYLLRPGRGEQVAERRRRSEEAERVWPRARQAAALLASFPWVRGVLVTGALSKQSASTRSDVDFLLLVEPGHVWSAKSALQGIRRILPGPIRELFCTNYLLATNSLLLDEQNYYTSMELATAVPLYGAEACVALLEQNRWVEKYLGGYEWAIERARRIPSVAPSRWERWTEPLQPSLEHWSLSLWNHYWNRKYDWLPENVRAQRFKRRPEVATNHLHDFQEYVLREFANRCDSVGIAP